MKILLVANVAKEHVNKFHIPTIKISDIERLASRYSLFGGC